MSLFTDKSIKNKRSFWLLLKPGLGPWTRTLGNLDPEKPGLRKTWTLKNLNPLLRIKSLSVKFSKYQRQSSGGVLKIFANSLKNIKNIHDAVFNLKFQAKRSTTLLKRDSGICTFLRISQKF